MGNSIFYQAGARAALVKLGAVPEDPYYSFGDPDADYGEEYSLPGLGSRIGHTVGGGLLGATAGVGAAELTKRLGGRYNHGMFGALGLFGGALAGGLGKTTANAVRNAQIAGQNDQLQEHMKNYFQGPRDAAAGQAFDEALAGRNAEVDRLKGRIRGMGY